MLCSPTKRERISGQEFNNSDAGWNSAICRVCGACSKLRPAGLPEFPLPLQGPQTPAGPWQRCGRWLYPRHTCYYNVIHSGSFPPHWSRTIGLYRPCCYPSSPSVFFIAIVRVVYRRIITRLHDTYLDRYCIIFMVMAHVRYRHILF